MLPYNKNNIKLAKALRKDMTESERKLWYTYLKVYPIRFQRQKAIGEYIADFYCAKARLIIEIDGSGHYEEEKEENDVIRTQKLEEINLKVVRFSNLDVAKNFKAVCETIDYEVQSRLKN